MLLREYIDKEKEKIDKFWIDYVMKHDKNKQGYPFERSQDEWDALLAAYQDRKNKCTK